MAPYFLELSQDTFVNKLFFVHLQENVFKTIKTIGGINDGGM